MEELKLLSLDLGAESGRAVVGHLDADSTADSYSLGGGNAVHLRHQNIHQNNIRVELSSKFKRLDAICGLADHLQFFI